MSSTFSSCARESSANGYARLTSRWSSSTEISSSAAIATICCASTSSGLRGITVSSIAPSSMRRATTADSSRSARNFGKMRPRETAPSSWPARPTRCRPRATDFGDSTWITRSTAPMSIPSSRDDVATRHGIRPAFSSSSTISRCSRASEPWCARATSSCSPSSLPSFASSFRRSARRSESRRLLTKRIVERCSRTSSRIFGYIDGQIEGCDPSLPVPRMSWTSAPCPGSRMSSSGTTTWRSSSFRMPASTRRIGRPPATKRPISSSGRWVAESPMR